MIPIWIEGRVFSWGLGGDKEQLERKTNCNICSSVIGAWQLLVLPNCNLFSMFAHTQLRSILHLHGSIENKWLIVESSSLCKWYDKNDDKLNANMYAICMNMIKVYMCGDDSGKKKSILSKTCSPGTPETNDMLGAMLWIYIRWSGAPKERDSICLNIYTCHPMVWWLLVNVEHWDNELHERIEIHPLHKEDRMNMK